MNLALPWGQPSAERLEEWLDHDPKRFEKHLTAHPEVGDAMDDLFALPLSAKALLSQSIAAPVDLVARLRSRLNDDRPDASTLAIDLLGLGPATIMLMLDDAP